ncbi:2-hydroxyacid dehydrogenase [Bacillus sp. NPDC077027]|uniref:2-hydroxyacid dehydrogenase n=1 Tax=Bacillus sp. NPDC077027 TaxID=3390548 RepID=UPI003CFE320C
MKPHVFVAKPLPAEFEELLKEHCTYDIWQSKNPIPRDVLYEKLQHADGLLTSGTKIDVELLEHAPKLKVVSNNSVGYDNYDLDAMKKRGVIGTHTPYTLDHTVADLAFSLILSSARRIAELDRFIRDGKWTKFVQEEDIFGIDVHHQTIGIIGMGRIGQQVAKRASRGFDMNVLYHNRSRNEEAETAYGAVYCSLDELLKQADIIVLITPLTEETYHMIGEREFKQMKQTALFVNISRGKTVDEHSLILALKEGWIKGAGLDVYENEPLDAAHPFLTMDQVTLAPHIGSATETTRDLMLKRAIHNVIHGIDGTAPIDIVKELAPSKEGKGLK